MTNELKKTIKESIDLKKKIFKQHKNINECISLIYKTIKNKKKVLICGNGGSAADAQHLAAEFLIRLRPNIDRESWPVISLTLDTSTLTACGNDYSFNKIFSRPLSGIGNEGDLLLTISTSGNSKNLIQAHKVARVKKINIISFLGKGGGKMKDKSDIQIIVPSKNTARIQEIHIFLGHYIFEQVENLLIKSKKK